MRLALLALALALVLEVGCGSKQDDAPSPTPTRSTVGHPRNGDLPPDFVCPGADACKPSDDANLFAGAAVEKITAPITEKLTFSARSKPWEFKANGGDKFEDANGNGVFDATWIAGFGTGRPAAGVNDDQYVRAVVLKQGNTSLAMVSIDCIGWMYEEVERTRAQLVKEGVNISYVFIAAAHDHEARDTMGIWGVDDATSGLDKKYNEMVRNMTVKAVKDALARVERVNATFGTIKVDGHLPGTDPAGLKAKAYVSDGRDPVIIDLTMNTLRLSRASDKSTVATVINFAAHAEFADDRNVMLSSDYVWTLREGVEKGVDSGGLKKAGLGGTAIYFQGALGGQIGPGQVEVRDFSGKLYPEPTDTEPSIGLARAGAIGTNYAYYALTSLDAGQGAQTYETMRIGVRARQIWATVENRRYHVAIASRLFDRQGYHFDEKLPIRDGNLPDLKSELAILDLGPAQMLALPGEIHPELVIGMAPENTPAPYVRVDPMNKNPPKLEKAPADGHLYQLTDPTAKFKWSLGLGNDMMGYLVPSWNYELDPNDPYYAEAPGDHYEETNSVGPKVEAEVIDPIRDMLKNTKTPITRP